MPEGVGLQSISYGSCRQEETMDFEITIAEDFAGDVETLLPQVSDYLNIERQYRQLMFFYEAGIGQLEARLDTLSREFQFSNDRNPIESVKSRIKSQESIIEKMKKKGLPLSVNALVENIQDIAGVRVVCPFIEDVYYVAKMLMRQKDVEVVQVKDYIKYPKENGYRSLHMIINVEVTFSEQVRKVPVEVQIRTIAMNFWASTEHQLRYKKDRVFTEDIQEELKECADMMALADEKMQRIAIEFGME